MLWSSDHHVGEMGLPSSGGEWGCCEQSSPGREDTDPVSSPGSHRDLPNVSVCTHGICVKVACFVRIWPGCVQSDGSGVVIFPSV